MKCPGCKSEMREVAAGDIKIDVCDTGCGGVWFDEDEISKFDNGAELDPTKFFTNAASKLSEARDSGVPRHCPRCEDQILVRQFYDVQERVVIEQCWNCSGIFTDRGELQILRSQYQREQDQKAAVEAHAQAVVTNTEKIFAKIRKERAKREELKETESRLESFVRMVDRVIQPSGSNRNGKR